MCLIQEKNLNSIDMIRASSGAEPKYLRIANKRDRKYAVAFDVRKEDDGSFSFMEETFDHLPTKEDIRQVINAYYNEQTEKDIITGFMYDGVPVWLSSENQFNFKAAFDLAIQTSGSSLPVKFKFGTDSEPVYKSFSTVEELIDFYTKAIAYIQKCLEDGWQKKDSVDYSIYVLSKEEDSL